MALSIKALADGQLANAKATLYTVPAATQAIVLLITLVNTDSSDRTANIYLKAGATSRRIGGKDFNIPAGGTKELRGPFTLEAGDLIEGDASVAAVVDHTINGYQNA